MANKKSVVLAALIANAAIAVTKFVGFLLTGSPSMLSETYHSVSDTGNQVFLLVGIRYSKKAASAKHPFGYGKAQFFYAFLVSVLLFGIAGWESTKHGYHKLNEALAHGSKGGHETAQTITAAGFTFPRVWVNYVVLIAAIVFESWALWKARKSMQREMEERGWDTYREAFRKTPDVTTLTAFTEDSIALGGAAIALVGVFLTETTGNPIYDAAAAVLIGLLLMSFALALAWENKRLLLGESLPKNEERRLQRVIEEYDGVDRLVDFRSVYFGAEDVLVTADVAFRDDMNTDEIDAAITGIEAEMRSVDDELSRVYIEPETPAAA